MHIAYTHEQVSSKIVLVQDRNPGGTEGGREGQREGAYFEVDRHKIVRRFRVAVLALGAAWCQHVMQIVIYVGTLRSHHMGLPTVVQAGEEEDLWAIRM
jgi:hypothetical protein